MRHVLLALVLMFVSAAAANEPPETPASRAERLVRLYFETDRESLAGLLAETLAFDSGRGEPRDVDGFLAFVAGNATRYTDLQWEITGVGVSSERIDVRGHWSATKEDGRRLELDFSFDFYFDEAGKVVRWVNEHGRNGINKRFPASGLLTTSHFRLVFDPTELEAEQAARLVRVCEEFYEKTSQYLGRSFEPGYRLQLNVSELHGSPYASAPGPDAFILIPLKSARREYGFSMVHEFTHNLTGLSHFARQPSTVQGRELHGGNRLLDEGFAVYVEEKLTAEPRVWPNWGDETHLGYRTLRAKMGESVWPLVEAELHRSYASTGDERRLAYFQQGSFCKWLAETHGLERFLRFFEQGIDSATAIYEKDLAALEASWRAFLEALAAASFEDGSPRQRPEFQAIVERLHSIYSKFFGRGRAERIREEMSATGLSADRGAKLGFDLVDQLLRDGKPQEAVEVVDRLLAKIEEFPSIPERYFNIHRLRGLAYLRLAEVENCVKRHNAECCLFPLEGGGVHQVKQPAEEARASYLAYLSRRGDDLAMRWLLNIANMALGDYPRGVPAELRIPPAAFEAADGVGRFTDIAPRLGIDTFNLCGGCIVDDFDDDGLLDIVTSTFDPDGPLTFYRNAGDGSFDDRSTASRVDDQLGGLNIVGADYDNDGDVDILVLRGAWLFDDGRIRNSLLRNNGDGTFSDVTREAGLAEPAAPTQAAAWGDFDNDGDLDLFIGNESRFDISPDQSEGDYPSQLFRNNGDGTFTDIAGLAGVTNDRYCKGVTVGDYDNDGDLDLYVSNIGPNRLYRNNGDGTFSDVARELGLTEPAGRSFATWFFDYDNDGWLDLFVAAYDADIADIAAHYLGLPHDATRPRLYHNNGDGSFHDATRSAGLDRPFLPMGANFGDLDNDGHLDIYLTTGEPSYEAIMPNVLLRNEGGRRFRDVSRSAGMGHLQKGHGVAFADLDNDGDQDIYHQLGGFYRGDGFHNGLFLNPGTGNRFLVVRLVGRRSPRAGYGARIHVVVDTPEGTRSIHRAAGSVSSFGGSPARQEIGLGNATAIRLLEVRWPVSVSLQRFTDIELDTFVEVTEGSDKLLELELRRIGF